MKTTDWKFDFTVLPRWDNHSRSSWIRDEYFEIPQSDMLCCIYSIEEVSMMNDQGFLAILKNKEKPELVLNVADGFSFCVNFSASDDGNLIFLQPSIYDRNTNRCHRPILVLDIRNNRFSFLRTKNYCPAYREVQKKANLFVVEADEQQRKGIRQLAFLHGKKIRTRWLRWFAMDELSALRRMVL